jgi:hypothetical protein
MRHALSVWPRLGAPVVVTRRGLGALIPAQVWQKRGVARHSVSHTAFRAGTPVERPPRQRHAGSGFSLSCGQPSGPRRREGPATELAKETRHESLRAGVQPMRICRASSRSLCRGAASRLDLGSVLWGCFHRSLAARRRDSELSPARIPSNLGPHFLERPLPFEPSIFSKRQTHFAKCSSGDVLESARLPWVGSGSSLRS